MNPEDIKKAAIEAADAANFCQYFKMEYWKKKPKNEKDLDELASKLYKYLKK